MTTTTPTTALADLDLDLDELRALCDAVKRPWYGTLQIADGVTDDDAVAFIEAFSPDTVSDLIALARRAAQPAEGAGQAGQVAMTEQQVADAIKEKHLVTDLGHRALINGDTINASLSLLTRLANSLCTPTERAAAPAELPSAQKGGA